MRMKSSSSPSIMMQILALDRSGQSAGATCISLAI